MMRKHAYTRNTELRHSAPFWRLLEVCDNPRLALLDSALPEGKLGRWSFLLPEPNLVVEARADDEIRGLKVLSYGSEGIQRQEFRPGDPFELIGEILRERSTGKVGDPGMEDSTPFLSGAVGWFGHGAGRFVDRQPESGLDVDGLPDIHLMFGDVVIAHEHDTGRSILATTGRGTTPDAAKTHAAELETRWRAKLEGFRCAPLPALPIRPRDVSLKSDLDQAGYMARVESIREDILAGRVFEVNLTQTLEADLKAEPWRLYQVLRETNPAPFATFLRTPEATIVSSSPERYLRLGSDGLAESRPIKGTRPRSADPIKDEELHRELATSQKDRAENIMIVDLVRSDLGRVCDTGSVTVPELCTVEGYATVWQMVSTVRGRLRADFDAMDLVRACHPPGSMTGAPKIEALAVIDEQESCRRGVYAGGIGYLDDRGGMDLHVVIRTAVVQGRRCRFGVGGAITADSDPHAEYQETMDKARALIRAVGLSEAGLNHPG